MSQDTKETVKEIKTAFEKIHKSTERLVKESSGFDKGLSEKIKRVQESSQEVVKHIEKRSG